MRFGNYILLRKLAAGGMAEVFLAKQTGLAGFERLVCVKRILPHLAEHTEFITMFLDEARIAAQLNHPNVVQIHELGEIDGAYFIAMEYIRGEDVRHVYNAEVARGRSMPFAAAAQIMHGACTGLAYAHRKVDLQGNPLHIVHRDVSPQNILVTYDGHVKLVDFGVAKARGKVNETRSGVLKGKYSYMSPEQANGREVDERSDLFSAGVILYEITTGVRLFKRENELETLHAVMQCAITPPGQVLPGYPAPLERIVMKALAVDPEQRYPSGLELARDLEEYLLASGTSASPVALGAYMGELFAERMAASLLDGDGDGDGELEEPSRSSASRPGTRSGRSGRSGRAKRPMVRWSERSQPSNPSALEAQPSGLLESLPTAGLELAVEKSHTLPSDPGDGTLSGPRPTLAIETGSSISRVVQAVSRQWPRLSIGLTVLLALGMLAAFVATVVNAADDEPVVGAGVDPLRRTGEVNVFSVPPGAAIAFPGLPADDPAALEALQRRTNFQLKSGLPRGRPVKVLGRLPGHLPAEQDFNPDDDLQVRLGITISFQRDTANAVYRPLTMRSEPRGATVYIDDLSTGRVTPLEGWSVEAGAVHRFTFVLDGYHPITISQEIPASGTLPEVAVTLKPIAGPVPAPLRPAGPLVPDGSSLAPGRPDGRSLAPAPAPARPSSGYLTVRSVIPYEVLLGKRSLGTTPLAGLPLKPGTHKLRLVNHGLQVEQQLTVTVAAGQEAVRNIPHTQGALAVNATPYALVWVSDRKQQETPVVFKGLVAGQHQVGARCPDGRTMTKSAQVKAGSSQSVSFNCLR